MILLPAAATSVLQWALHQHHSGAEHAPDTPLPDRGQIFLHPRATFSALPSNSTMGACSMWAPSG